MDFREAFKLALQSLWANKLRTVLTLLGVVIGVASVIAVVTLVNGADTFVLTKFSSYGADVFTVTKMPQIITNSEDYERYQRRKPLLFEDYKYVQDNCQKCVGMGAQQATVGQGRPQYPIHHRRADSRLHVGDAAPAKPGYHARSRPDRGR